MKRISLGIGVLCGVTLGILLLAVPNACLGQDEPQEITFFVRCQATPPPIKKNRPPRYRSDEKRSCYHFDRPKNTVDLPSQGDPPGGWEPPQKYPFDVVQVVRGSSILFYGTVLKIKTDVNCAHYDWYVVAQANESSSVVIYQPSDIAPESCGSNPKDSHTLYLALPITIQWAEIHGYSFDIAQKTAQSALDGYHGDSVHKVPSALSVIATDCLNRSMSPSLTPDEWPPDVRLCDRHRWPGNFIDRFGWAYTTLTQPGTGQGSIAYSPVIGGIGYLAGQTPTTPVPPSKLSWAFDVQVGPSGKVGAGWLGVPTVFEKNFNVSANLDSYTTGLSYEVHFANLSGFTNRPPCHSNVKTYDFVCRETGARWATIRSLALQLRSGIEYAPTSPHDFNAVQSGVLKLPFVINRRLQPSFLTIYPVGGFEAVTHLETHPIFLVNPDSSISTTVVPETSSLMRYIAGADASMRLPYILGHNFFGSKPNTIDYSYRIRWLSDAEPTTKETPQPGPILGATEYLSGGAQVFQKMAYSAPISSYLQFKVTAQHGALPPDFHALGWSVSSGLTFSDPGAVEH